MRWQDRRESNNVEDRRQQGGGGGIPIGGKGAVAASPSAARGV
ncbi:neutral zinc metallopeptidase [Aeromonas hydrophila]|nr:MULTISPECIES: neutral zinc metallopeptidase [Aeromonas]MDD9308676.1 neutral zinc metallopeptidase [Aeromonas hydrophila]